MWGMYDGCNATGPVPTKKKEKKRKELSQDPGARDGAEGIYVSI